MAHWDHLAHAAIGQFYHVAIDNRHPYRVYGGLQDNGSWGGPTRTNHPDGIVLDDWKKVFGQDGFHCACDPTDPSTVYAEGQYGNLQRNALRMPGVRNVDASLIKNFAITEGTKVALRCEVFNLFNHPQYQASALSMQLNFNAQNCVVGPANPNCTTGPEFKDAAGNSTTSIANAVSIQNTTLNAGNFGKATQSRENGWRQLQYGLKISF
jgi:hypothetical protein